MTSKKPSISLIVPAYNEEGNLDAAVNDLVGAMGDKFSDYEILIFNDCSTDKTAEVAERLAKANPKIRVAHHVKNRGLGYTISRGYKAAAKEYVMWYPGDNGMQRASLDVMFDNAGKADMVIPYIANPEFRSPARRFISNMYITVMNALFGLHLRYYNGVVIYKTELVQSVKTCTHGFSSIAELLIRLARAGYSYIEIPTYHQQRSSGNSKAFRFNNLRDIAVTLLKLSWELRVQRKNPLNFTPYRKMQSQEVKDPVRR